MSIAGRWVNRLSEMQYHCMLVGIAVMLVMAIPAIIAALVLFA